MGSFFVFLIVVFGGFKDYLKSCKVNSWSSRFLESSTIVVECLFHDVIFRPFSMWFRTVFRAS